MNNSMLKFKILAVITKKNGSKVYDCLFLNNNVRVILNRQHLLNKCKKEGYSSDDIVSLKSPIKVKSYVKRFNEDSNKGRSKGKGIKQPSTSKLASSMAYLDCVMYKTKGIANDYTQQIMSNPYVQDKYNAMKSQYQIALEKAKVWGKEHGIKILIHNAILYCSYLSKADIDPKVRVCLIVLQGVLRTVAIEEKDQINLKEKSMELSNKINYLVGKVA